uniref:Uncharacterized protein n=1 Tax=Neolamprologus brichardi TaxID=32507 RepID=A0A3Q4HEP9_NEOBR
MGWGGGSRAWSPCCRVVTLRQPQFLCSAAFISFILFIALIFTPTSVTSLFPLSEQILYYPHSSFSPSTPDQVLTLSWEVGKEEGEKQENVLV